MAREMNESTLKEHLTDNYTLSLVHQDIWWPTMALYDDQTDYVSFDISDQIRLGLRYPHYEATITVVEVTAKHKISEFDWKKRSKDKLKEICMAEAQKNWQKLQKRRNLLDGFYGGMLESLDDVWNLYNTIEVPREFWSSGNFFKELEIARPQSYQDRIDEVEREADSLSDELYEAIEDHDDDEGRLKAALWIDEVERTRDAYVAIAKKLQPLRDMVAVIEAQDKKHPRMSREDSRELESRSRRLLKDIFKDILPGLKMAKIERRYWERMLR